MLSLRGLSLLALLSPMTLAAAPKGEGLTQKEIVSVIQSHSDDAVACFKEVSGEDAKAGGKVKIRFLIGLQGKIETSQVEQNSFKDKAIGNCIRNKMKTWIFPKPRGGLKMNTSYPFVFQVAPPPPPPPTPETPGTAPGTPPTAPGTPESPGTAPAMPPTPEAPQAPTQP